MAAGKPIVFGSSDGETSRLLEKAGGVLMYSPERPEQLANTIRDLYYKKIDGDRLGQRYHEFVKNNHSRNRWAGRYLNLLEKIEKY
jgi:hypothetical protein